MQRIIEQNQRIEQPYDLMTDFPDPDSNSVASNVDSLFDISFPTQWHNTDSYTSSDSSISSESSHTIATCSTTSMDWFENPAPPPPGSLLDLWDTPFFAGTFHDFKDLFQDGRVAMDTTTITEDLTDSDSSISSTSAIDIPAHTAPVLQFVAATTTVVGIGPQGQLVDSGRNFNMCNDITMLINVHPITPFGISMAATPDKSVPTCTHCGDFPIPMLDGSVFYTPMYYNPQASDCILSPHAICRSSRGYLSKWVQQGNHYPPSGRVTFYNKQGDAVIRLDLEQRNGLYYTTTTATAIDHPLEVEHPSGNRAMYVHTEEGIGWEEDEEASLDWDIPLHQAFANINIEAPTTNPPDLWQAQLGHCGEWQLRVIPHAVHGTPTQFTPHPFSSYEHYNPSNCDYSRPDKSNDRVIESFDGYNSYLLVVDEHTRFIWVFVCKSKEPPMALVNLHLDIFGSTVGGSIRCDQGGELARCHDFVTQMALRQYTVEPTGVDDPAQNKSAEKWNDVLAVTVRVLLYGSGLPAIFWYAALLHAIWLHNRRVHRSIMITPFEAWYGIKPNLSKLRVFGSHVCVKRTGKRRSKLDRHDFTGIFLGYTATDENIKYVDVDTRVVKTSHHAIFDEAWSLQQRRPPFAQMLYDIGLEYVPDVPAPPQGPPPHALYPPMHLPPKLPPKACSIPLPLRLSSPPDLYLHAAAARTHTGDLTSDILLTSQTPSAKLSLDHEIMTKHDISQKDTMMVYMSPHPFRDSFEEEFCLRYFDNSKHPTAGIVCSQHNGRLYIRDIQPSTPAAKIRAWRSRLRHAWLIKVDGEEVTTEADIVRIMARLAASKSPTCTLLMAHSELKHGLVESGIPQINADQLNH
eukprot:CCRYP_001875-RA/>CCRYP_001875-RA protein AED:0.38 eAED:0.38 QI:0/0/0/1/0/0/3/0/857